MTILGQSQEALGALETVVFDVSLLDYDPMTQTIKYLKCGVWAATGCKFKMSRLYTPLLYQVSPPVVYYGAETSFWVDVKQA